MMNTNWNANTHTEEERRRTVGVIGLTVTGLAWAAVQAERGLTVLATDPDEDMAEGIQEEMSLPGVEPGLKEALEAQIKSGGLTILTQPRRIFRECRFITLCGMTPAGEDGSPSLRLIESVVRQAVYQCPEETVLAVKATLPPGGIRALQRVADEAAQDQEDAAPVHVIALPELYDDGAMLKAMRRDAPIVVGADGRYQPTEAVLDVMDPDGSRRIYCTPEDAEAAAVSDAARTAFEQVLANYWQDVAADCGASGQKVLEILAKGEKGRRRAGLGLSAGAGGRRLSQELANLSAFEKQEERSLIDAFQAANTAHFEKMKAWLLPPVQKITAHGGKIAVLGLSNVPGTDDLRETPAVELLKAMAAPFEDRPIESGKPFALYLPWGMDQAKWRLFRTRDAFTFCGSCAEATRDAELVVVLGAWPGMGRMLTPALAKRMAGRQIVDVTGSLDKKKIAALGLKPVGLFEKLEDLN